MIPKLMGFNDLSDAYNLMTHLESAPSSIFIEVLIFYLRAWDKIESSRVGWITSFFQPDNRLPLTDSRLFFEVIKTLENKIFKK